MVVRKILNFFLGFVSLIRAIFRRMICRISGKGRRNSGMLLPMTNDNVSIPQQSVPLTNEVSNMFLFVVIDALATHTFRSITIHEHFVDGPLVQYP